MESVKLFTTAYFAPLSYYVHWVSAQGIYIEMQDNYQKQTYRNRCYIYGANGKLMLNIPVEHAKGKRLQTKDVRICNQQDWQKTHWKSICTAYMSSPYFEFYEDDLYPFFRKKEKYLIDLNFKINQLVCSILEIEMSAQKTCKYIEHPQNILDLREVIHPKKELNMEFKAYTQVFSNKYGFIPNLSILDLIFCEGNNAMSYLLKSNV